MALTCLRSWCEELGFVGTSSPPAPPPARVEAHAVAAAEVARHRGVEADTGLEADEVVARRRRNGPNPLREPPPRPA
ncbi:MAG: hypothetical protein C0505_08855 [Leptothrix sp. (in: Bacteria)]|nr:hypothetical protein [Leptothrix sp. (in: b-proteobacteria)]